MTNLSFLRKAASVAVFVLLGGFSATAVFAQKVVATVPAQEGSEGLPLTIAVNPFTQLVYIAGNGVEVVDQRTNTLVTTISVGQNQLSGIAINPGTRKLYVIDYNTGLYVIDLTTNRIVGQAAISSPSSITYNPVTNRIYTLGGTTASISVNDGTTGAPIKQITVPAAGSTIQINPVTNLLYLPVPTSPGQLLVIHPDSGAIQTVALQGSASNYTGIDSLRNIIYVSDQNGGVDVVNGATNKHTAFVAGIPIQPEGLSVDPFTQLVYLCNANGSVYVINGKTNTVASTFAVGTNPIYSTIDLVHSLLYVGNTAEFQPGTQNVSVVKLN